MQTLTDAYTMLCFLALYRNCGVYCIVWSYVARAYYVYSFVRSSRRLGSLFPVRARSASLSQRIPTLYVGSPIQHYCCNCRTKKKKKEKNIVTNARSVCVCVRVCQCVGLIRVYLLLLNYMICSALMYFRKNERKKTLPFTSVHLLTHFDRT